MTVEMQNKILKRALFNMAKVLRENPPLDMDWFLQDMRRMKFLAGGSERDPEGKEIAIYFVQVAAEEVQKEGE